MLTGHGERCLVVGVGASAGGLEALELFFGGARRDPGLAYVVVQHLSPSHQSSLVGLLQRSTEVPVVLASHGIRVEGGQAYAIPPGTGLAMDRGTLRFVPLPTLGTQQPINAFLTSLAEDQGDNAAAVVLSGSGSDGALGIASIKLHGGTTFAQRPAEARYDGMPAAAIASHMVDHVLPAGEIAAALADLALERRRHPPERPDSEEEGIRRGLEVVARVTGHDFSRYKRSTVLRRFRRRVAATGAPSVLEYATRLGADPDEARRLADDMTINVTSFFRDAEPFAALERRAVPDILARRAGMGLRVWVPGCSSGEEAYSLAMLFREQREAAGTSLQVFATDIDPSALAEARLGRYAASTAAQVSPERLARFFARRGESYTVTKALRDLCIFTPHDLLKDPPFSRMDLVSCRNLLIYLEPAVQRRVIELLHFALRPGGWLFLGRAEALDPRDVELFTQVEPGLFQRREVERRTSVVATERRTVPLEVAPIQQRWKGEAKSAAERSRDLLLEEFAPASVVVDARGEIRYYWGAGLERYLPPHPGAPATNVMHLARRELRAELSATLNAAVRENRAASCREMAIDRDGARHRLDLVVRPLRPTEREPDELYLVVFQELREAPGAPGQPLEPPTLEQHRRLQQDHAHLQDRLQSTLDELEHANEALHASNEQLQAMNEEMLSSNEELQTSQEELQSVNEELNSLNAELSKKVDELELLYGDLQNLFQSTQIATVFLDRNGRIARFTPAATEVFRLAEGDVGRPIADFAVRFDAKEFPEEVRRVMDGHEPVERTVSHPESGRFFLMRIHPYRTPSDVIAGVVVSFVDVTRLKQVEAELRQAVEERVRAEQALQAADRRKDRFLAVLSHELRNPLAPIRSAVHVLERATDPVAMERAREIVAHQSAHLARLVDDLLEVTRIATGKLQIELGPVDLGEVCRATVDDHRSLFVGRGVSLRTDLPPGPVLVNGDGTRLAQALGNLLLNAAKFTSSGDTVSVSLRAAGGWAELRVVDTGIGIEPELIPQLFQAFSQADTTLNRSLGGLGLGLALVKGLVEGHSGTVTVTSRGPGSGAEFTILLPALPHMRRAPEAPNPRGPRRRILVVEDNEDAADSLMMALELEGHTAATAPDGPTGLARARELSPDAVLCDVGLPGIDGYAVARAFREDPKLRNTFLVALTGYALPEDKQRAREAGFDAHLAKPVTVEAVEAVLARAGGPAPAPRR